LDYAGVGLHCAEDAQGVADNDVHEAGELFGKRQDAFQNKHGVYSFLKKDSRPCGAGG